MIGTGIALKPYAAPDAGQAVIVLDPMAENCVFFLGFDDPDGHLIDYTDNHNDFSATGSPTESDGKRGSGLGVSDGNYISLEHNSDISTEVGVSWAFSMIFKPTDMAAVIAAEGAWLVNKVEVASETNNEWGIGYEADVGYGALYLEVTESDYEKTWVYIEQELADDEWYWLLSGYDADSNEYYLHLDSASNSETPAGVPLVDAETDLCIGGTGPYVPDFPCVIDDAWMVKGSVPTAAQITALYNDGDGVGWFGFRNLFYGFDSLDLTPFEVARMRGTATAPDTTWPQYWAQSNGLRDDITFQSGSFYPVTVLSGYSGFRYKAQQTLGNDQWASFRICSEGAWSSDEWIGVFVRQALDAETFYGCVVDSNNIKLIKVVSGAAEVVLDSTLGYTPSIGDLIVLKANGTDITVDVAGVTDLLEAVDSDIASGVTGVLGHGNQSTNRAGDFRTGNLPVGNLAVSATGWTPNVDENADGVAIVEDCGGAFDVGIIFDHNFGNTDSESADHTHYVEIDFGEIRLFDGFRSWADSSSGSYQYDDVTIQAKMIADAEWSTLFANEDLSHASPAADQWCPSDAGIRFTPFAARYVRVEIASTEEASDYIAMTEWEFHG